MSRSPQTDPERSADLPRHPTGDPLRYLIPADALPPGFAERVARPVAAPAPPRPASTVVLARESPGGLETLLLLRPRRSRFAADHWVFPGGAVDAADAALDLDADAVGPTAGQWAVRLGVADPAEATGYLAAALREAWEETGILLAEGDLAPARLRAARTDLLRGACSLGEVLTRHGLRLDTRGLLYIAHWITPEAEPRRYDTRFFLARVPGEVACELIGEELVEARWLPPGQAVARALAGEMKLLPPTLHTLRRLAEHPSLDLLWAELRDAAVPTYLPRMRRHPEGVEVEVATLS